MGGRDVSARDVHGRSTDDEVRLLRDDRAGHWYLERRPMPAHRVSFAVAVDAALRYGMVLAPKPGGSTLRRAVGRFR